MEEVYACLWMVYSVRIIALGGRIDTLLRS